MNRNLVLTGQGPLADALSAALTGGPHLFERLPAQGAAAAFTQVLGRWGYVDTLISCDEAPGSATRLVLPHFVEQGLGHVLLWHSTPAPGPEPRAAEPANVAWTVARIEEAALAGWCQGVASALLPLGVYLTRVGVPGPVPSGVALSRLLDRLWRERPAALTV